MEYVQNDQNIFIDWLNMWKSYGDMMETLGIEA